MADTAESRPALWVGHVSLPVSDVAAAYAFYQAIGMRSVHQAEDFAILELRGGTHVLLEDGEPPGGDAPFDLMVDDLDSVHAAWSADGLDVSDIIRGDIHDVFVLTDPDDYRFVVYNSHAVGPV